MCEIHRWGGGVPWYGQQRVPRMQNGFILLHECFPDLYGLGTIARGVGLNLVHFLLDDFEDPLHGLTISGELAVRAFPLTFWI